MLRPLIGLIQKEFVQIFRDPNMLRIIFAIPLIQLVLFGYVVSTEVKLLDLDVYDFDRSQTSRELVNSCRAGDYFIPTEPESPLARLEDRFRSGDAEMALIIPEDFSEKMARREQVEVGFVADGSNSNSTAIGSGYMSQIVQRFSQRELGLKRPLSLNYQFLYNPEMESVFFMVPGIVAALLTMLTVMLTSMAIVRERENGTLEQIMVTPISTTVFLIGKVLPFAALGLFELAFVLGVGTVWFGVPFVGSPLLLLGLAALYLLTTLGIGLFFSTVTSTQQQAMFFAWFFSIFAMLTSGFFTPISNMPDWMQMVTLINPMRYFMEIARGIMMKGSGLFDLGWNVWALVIYGPVIFGLSLLRFQKRTG